MLVDAAIFGFAIGSGFALVENLYYLASRPDAHVAVQIIRGFGTAIMHGGATAIFAIVSVALAEKRPDGRARCVPARPARRGGAALGFQSPARPSRCSRRSASCSRCRR